MPSKKVSETKAKPSKKPAKTPVSKVTRTRKPVAEEIEVSSSRRNVLAASKVEKISTLKKTVETSSKQEKPSKKDGLSIDIYDTKGLVSGKTDLPSEIFGVTGAPQLLSQAIRVYLANQRASSAHTKTRGEVTGSTRKIYRQKGTGRARHGAITAPIFVGGGIVHGPRTHSFSRQLSQKMRRKALFAALSQKYQDKELVVVDTFEKLPMKTKEMVKALSKLPIAVRKKRIGEILFVLPNQINSVSKAARNIKGITVDMAQNLNTYEVLRHTYIVLMKDSIGRLSEVFLKGSKNEN